MLHIERLPTPLFQGLAGYVEEHPVIVIGYDIDEPARLAFIIAHEIAHITHGDCEVDSPVVDEEEEVSDDHQNEACADDYAIDVMTGGVPVPTVQASDFKELATKAAAIEKERRIDASAVVWAWARRTLDYGLAMMASRALYRMKGGKRVLRAAFDVHVDLDHASDSDRALLRCLHGGPRP